MVLREKMARSLQQALERLTVTDSPRGRREKKGNLRAQKLNVFLSSRPSETVAVENVASRLPQWSDFELKYLVDFILLHSTGDTWPAHKDIARFWTEAGCFVQRLTATTHLRSGIMGRNFV